MVDAKQLAALQAQQQALQNLAPPPQPPPAMPGPGGMQQVAAMPPPQAPAVQPEMATINVPPPKGPGPIKQLLSGLLYGGGQAMLQHVGLPTDYEKQQQAAKIQIAQEQADTAEQYRQGLIAAQQQRADTGQQRVEQQAQTVTPVLPSAAVAAKFGLDPNTPIAPAVHLALTKALGAAAVQDTRNQGTEAVAATRADALKDVANTRADSAEKNAQLNAQVRRDVARGQLGMAAARFNLAKAKASGQMNGNNPTAMRLNKADLANNAQHNLGNAIDIIDQSPDLFGKIRGHFTTVEQMMGSDDPRITRLGNELHAAAQASGGVHGLRSADAVKDTENKWLNGFRNSPAATKAGLQAQSDSLNDYVNFANYGKANAPRIPNSSQPESGKAAAGGGVAPEGTVVKMADGSTRVKRGGQWVNP